MTHELRSDTRAKLYTYSKLCTDPNCVPSQAKCKEPWKSQFKCTTLSKKCHVGYHYALNLSEIISYIRPFRLLWSRWFARLIWPWERSNYPSRFCNGPNGPKGSKFKQYTKWGHLKRPKNMSFVTCSTCSELLSNWTFSNMKTDGTFFPNPASNRHRQAVQAGLLICTIYWIAERRVVMGMTQSRIMSPLRIKCFSLSYQLIWIENREAFWVMSQS